MNSLKLIASALLLTAGAVYAEPPEPMAPGHPGMMEMMGGHGGMPGCDMKGMEKMKCGDDDGPMEGLCGDLDLTDEQEAKAEKICYDNQRKMVERKSTMVDLQTKLKLAMTADKYSQKDIDDIAAKMGKFHQEGVLLRAAHLKAIRDLLTPEQKMELDEKVLKMGHGQGMGMGKGMGKGRHGMGKGMKDCGQGGCD